MKNITFINAGAGSGKTYSLIEHLYSWVVEKNNAPQKVLLTTFTKKAAAEIREKAQGRMLSEQRFNEANQLQEALMGTIHSVGYTFIKKYWYLLDISPEVREISENEQEVFFTQAIAEVPTDQELDRLSHLNFSFNFCTPLGHYIPEKWRQDVLKIMEEAQSNHIDLNDEQSQQFSLKKAEEIFSGTLKGSVFPEVVEQCKNVMFENVLDNKTYPKIKQEFDKYLSKLDAREVTLKDIRDFWKLYKSICGVYNAQKYTDIYTQIPEFDYPQIDLLREMVLEYTTLVFDVARRAMDSYQSFKLERGLVDFTDMEVYFLQLLDNPIVMEEINHTIDLVMVDEFQDSNPIQLSIFIKLSELVKHSYWVGDPKQSIYGFRGTDPQLIQGVINEFTKQDDNRNLNIELLKMSWRSTPKLVEFSNTIFSERMKDQAPEIHLTDQKAIKGLDKSEAFKNWREAASITPLSASDTIKLIPARPTEKEGSETFAGIYFWQSHRVGNNGALTQGTKGVLHQQLVGRVKQLLFDKTEIFCDKTHQRRQIRLSDICILTGINHHVGDIAQSFQEAGYAANAIVGGLSETIEFRILQDVVTLFLDPNHALSNAELAMVYDANLDTQDVIADRLKLVIPMLHAGNGKLAEAHYTQLNDWLKDAHHRKLVESLREQSAYLSVSNLLQKVVNHFNLFQKMLGYPRSAIRQANLLRLIELAEDYESYANRMNQGAGLSGFFSYVTANPKKDVQAGTNEDAITVMTYFKSKGLEWPFVILSGLELDYLCDSEFYYKQYFNTRANNNKDFDIHNPLENRVIDFSFWPFGSKGTPPGNLLQKLEQREDRNRVFRAATNEESRLMYVAITRARDGLAFTSYTPKKLARLNNVLPDWNPEEAVNQFRQQAPIESDFFGIGRNITFEMWDQDNHKTADYVRYPDEQSYFKKEIPKAQHTPYYQSPSMQPPLTGAQVGEPQQLHDKLEYPKADAGQVGDALHALLYHSKRNNFEDVVKCSPTLKKLNIDPQRFIENTRKFQDYLHQQFDPFDHYEEYFMEYPNNGTLASGEADLILEQEEGLILIDYKTFPGQPEQITNPHSDFYAGKYSGQLNLYAHMATARLGKPVTKQLIYYVVQGVVVEIIPVDKLNK